MTRHADEPAPAEARVPWATLLKIGAAVLAAWVCVKLWTSVELLLFSALIAIAMSPLVHALERRRLSRGRAVGLLALGVLVAVAAFAFLALPPLVSQIGAMWKGLPAMRGRIAHTLEGGGLAARVLLPLLDLPHAPEVDAWLARPLAWGPPAFELAGASVVVVVLSLYLLLDGPKVVAWLLAYAPRAHRRRMGDMVPELFSVVQAYTTGQLIASSLFAAFAGIVLAATGVPGVLPVALLAFVCDVIPVAGISVVIAVASLLALTISPATALLVGSIFLAYHLFEAYVLLPRLYGNRLRLSTLTVLLAILGGGTLGGIPGAVLALPLVAAYPVVEKHWLDEWLHPDAVADHLALRDTEDERRQTKLVNAVLQGRPADATR
ncbi:MAG TPA: AI-2E family transporter [Thermoanaerobaculia bacterium]|nr:AI-2E family transporter [Thermoanaerobaculia bacterium]